MFVESLFDALSIWQAGERAVVPLYGADGFTGHHEKLVRETEAHEIVLALDSDEAGRAGTQRLREKLPVLLAGRTPPVPVRALAWPDGCKDANAFFSNPSRPAADFAALVANAEPKPPTAAPVATEEKVEPRENGFAVIWPTRRYEVIAAERLGAAKLRATVKALGPEPGRFHVETLDLYSARTRRLFAAEVARAFRLPPELIEADLGKLLLAAEQHAGSEGAEKKTAAVIVSEPDRAEGLKLGRAADLVGEIVRDFSKLGIVGETTNGLLLYLTLTSRKMADPLAAHVVSGSGAGKSHLQDAVLTLCPDEDLIKLTSLSSQALFYKGRTRCGTSASRSRKSPGRAARATRCAILSRRRNSPSKRRSKTR
ncbi:MAG: toprim domain-containing protein [Opitutaceae bacterium]